MMAAFVQRGRTTPTPGLGVVKGSNGAAGLNPAGPGERLYDTPGVYELPWPFGVSQMRIEVYGAGGAGGLNHPAAGTTKVGGGGGGGGGYFAGVLGGAVMASTGKLTITVGAGGTQPSGAVPGDGGTTQIASDVYGPLLQISGGSGGGKSQLANYGLGGAGRTASIIVPEAFTEAVASEGTNGLNAVTPQGVGGAGGLNGAGGVAGSGGAVNTAGGAGGLGCGGGGAGSNTAGGPEGGGAGGRGQVYIKWPPA